MMITFKDKINFGMYKDANATVGEVFRNDATYIDWCINNIDWFKMSKADTAIVKKKADKIRHEHYSDMVGAIDHYDFCF